MQLKTSNQNKVEALNELGYELAVLYAKDTPGEAYHPEYKKNKEVFRKLILSQQRLYKNLKQHFKDLAYTAQSRIDWQAYYNNVKTAATYTKKIDWQDEILQLQILFEGELDDIFVYGGLAGQVDTGINIGVSKNDTETINALKKYGLQLAKGLTDTTRSRVNATIQRSIEMGLSQEEASKRLTAVIDDPKRAKMISHTETVNAYTQGKLEVGRRVGAKYKVWVDGQPGACAVCSRLHGKVVILEGYFKGINGGEFQGSPAHPWCKCLTKLAMDESFISNVLATEGLNQEVIEGKAGKSKKGKGLIWITVNGRSFPINGAKSKKSKGTNGVGFNYKKLVGVSLKRSTDIHMDSTNLGTSRRRVVQYMKFIKGGGKITPILIHKSDNGWTISDGHHRFSALKRLKHKWIPTVKEQTSAYGKAVEADNAAMSKL